MLVLSGAADVRRAYLVARSRRCASAPWRCARLAGGFARVDTEPPMSRTRHTITFLRPHALNYGSSGASMDARCRVSAILGCRS